MKYFLIGYMASGKSRKGRLMAKELGLTFIDLDAYIVRREACSIPDIFRSGGEEEFRKAERRCLHEVCELYESFVMATGGGTPCYFDNMDYMNAQGKTLFLNPDIDTLVARLLRKKEKRPLVSHLPDSRLRDFVEAHLRERMPYYMQAQEIIE